MPLSDVEIWAELGAGRLIIDPHPDTDRVDSSSIDLLLHEESVPGLRKAGPRKAREPSSFPSLRDPSLTPTPLGCLVFQRYLLRLAYQRHRLVKTHLISPT